MASKPPKMKPLTRMLEDPNKEIHKTYGAHGLLSKLFRVMLKDMKVTGYRFSLLMEKYLNDPKNNVPNNLKERTSNRGNTNKELSNPRMSWKVFAKAMSFLRLRGFRLTIEAWHPDGTTTIHSVDVNLMDEEVTFPEDDSGSSDDVIRPIPGDQDDLPYLDEETPDSDTN